LPTDFQGEGAVAFVAGNAQKLSYADGGGGVLYSASSGPGASPVGYVALACNPPVNWVY